MKTRPGTLDFLSSAANEATFRNTENAPPGEGVNDSENLPNLVIG